MALSGINSLAIQGLVSGLDTESIIKEATKYRQQAIDRLTSQKTDLQFRKTTIRSFNTQLVALQNALFNLRMETAFKNKKATSSDDKVVSVIAGTSASAGQHTVKVKQLAQQAKVSSNLYTPRLSASPANTAGLDGIAGAIAPTPMFLLSAACEGTSPNTIGTSIGTGSNNLKVTVDGTTVTVTLANATANSTSLSTVASDLALKINDALNQARGTSNVNYVVTSTTSTAGASNDKIYLISNFDGAGHSISVDSTSSAAAALGFNNPASVTNVAGTDPSGGTHNLTFYAATQANITGADKAGLFTIDATNNKLNITINGVNHEITLTSQSDLSADLMAAALQSDIDAAFDSGLVTVNYDGSKFQIVNNKAGASNNLVLETASGSDARATLGLDTATTAAGTNARVVDVFNPDTGASNIKVVEDTTEAGTVSNMAGLLKAINGTTPDSGHTSAGNGPLMWGVTLSSTGGLTAGTAVVRTKNGNELNTTGASNAAYASASDIATTTLNLSAIGLHNSGFRTAPGSTTNGTFTINGKTITISDYTSESVNDIMAKINSSGAGVTCSYDSIADRLVLTANTTGDQTISIGSATDTSDFLTIAGFYGTDSGFSAGTTDQKIDPTVALTSARFSTIPNSGIFTINDVAIYVNASTDTLDDVIAKINNSAAGVTASYNATTDTFSLVSKTDESGRDIITLGSAEDTSNFFWATKLVYPPNIETDGSPTVLNTKIVVGQPGQRALFEVDGSSYNRKSNSVSDVLTGVTLNLNTAQENGSAPVTIDIASSTDQALETIAKFIVEYNKTMEMASPEALTDDEREDQLPELTDDDKEGMTADEIYLYNTNRDKLRAREVMRKDTSVQAVYSDLRRMVSEMVGGVSSDYGSLAGIGINTGEIGATWGSNPHGMLVTPSTDYDTILEELKANTTFMDRLNANPEEMSKLFSQLNDATYTKNGTETVTSLVLGSDNKVRIGNGTTTVDITIPADTYTGAQLVNFINNKLSAAGLTDISLILNSYNKVDVKSTVKSSDNPKGQARLDISDVTGSLFRTQLGITPGFYYGPTVESLTGIARRLETVSKEYTSVGGVLYEKIKDSGDIDRLISNVNDRIDDMQDRMEQEVKRLYSRFVALESYMNNANAQSAWIAQNMASTSGSGG
ncbi:MAG: flagellar filament capping protein FliD [Firmicutes bacterium]|nr:flagellar filament capping protein FliD [Bacillota bacterium]